MSAEECKEAGNTFLRTGDPARAILEYSKGIELLLPQTSSTTSSSCSSLLAILYSNRCAARLNLGGGQLLPEALQDAQTALQIDPNYIKAMFRYAQVCHAMKDYSIAKERLHMVMERSGGADNAPDAVALLRKISLEEKAWRSSRMRSLDDWVLHYCDRNTEDVSVVVNTRDVDERLREYDVQYFMKKNDITFEEGKLLLMFSLQPFQVLRNEFVAKHREALQCVFDKLPTSSEVVLFMSSSADNTFPSTHERIQYKEYYRPCPLHCPHFRGNNTTITAAPSPLYTFIIARVATARFLGPMTMYPGDEEVVLPMDWIGTVRDPADEGTRFVLENVMGLSVPLSVPLYEATEDDVSTSLGTLPKALVQSCKRRLEDDPYNADLNVNCGLILQTLGDVDGAMISYEEGLRTDPTCGAAHRGLARILETKDTTAASSHYDQSLQYDPLNPSTHNNYGVFLDKHGHTEQARFHLEKAVELSNDNPDYLSSCACFLANHNLDVKRASQLMDKAIQLNPKSFALHEMYGSILHHHVKDLGRAQQQYEAALQLNGMSATIHLQLGVLLAERLHFERAKHHYAEAVRLDPTLANKC